MSTQEIVIKNPKEPRSFKQVKKIFAQCKNLGYSDDKIKALQKKAHTKGQASAIIKCLLIAQAKRK